MKRCCCKSLAGDEGTWILIEQQRMCVCVRVRTLFQQLKPLRSKKCWCSWSAEASFSDRDSLADCCQPSVHRLRRKRLWWLWASWRGLKRKTPKHTDKRNHIQSHVPGRNNAVVWNGEASKGGLNPAFKRVWTRFYAVFCDAEQRWHLEDEMTIVLWDCS